MITLLFFILMLVVFAKILFFAIGATWGIARILFSIVLLPLILVGLVLKGLIVIAFPVLAVIGLITVLGTQR